LTVRYSSNGEDFAIGDNELINGGVREVRDQQSNGEDRLSQVGIRLSSDGDGDHDVGVSSGEKVIDELGIAANTPEIAKERCGSDSGVLSREQIVSESDTESAEGSDPGMDNAMVESDSLNGNRPLDQAISGKFDFLA
jgi:hypothetical protein